MNGSDADHLKIQAAAAAGLEDYASAAGLDFSRILDLAGLAREQFENSSGYISLRGFSDLLELCSTGTSDELFALRFATQQPPEAAGALTYAMVNARTVHEGLQTMIRYLRTRLDIAHVELTVDGSRAYFGWSVSPLLIRRTQFTDYSAGTLVRRIARMIGSASWRPREVRLERKRPHRPELHKLLIGRTEFGQHVNALVFDASTLDLPLVNADPHLHELAIHLLDRLIDERSRQMDSMIRIREELMWMLASADGVQIDRLARRLGTSTRSLQRQLTAQGSSFRMTLDETRKLIARQYLEDSELSLSQIAYRLGFSGPSSFTRAARRWFGTPPNHLRRAGRKERQTSAHRLRNFPA